MGEYALMVEDTPTAEEARFYPDNLLWGPPGLITRGATLHTVHPPVACATACTRPSSDDP